MKQALFPTLDDLRSERVLLQAWKKTASYLRQHSWYVDTLELDYQSLRLSDFLHELQERLQAADSWESAPLEIVPAPKSQPWQLDGGIWKPKGGAHSKIRPLAHASLSDQVAATAMLLCLADRIEQSMGDPLLPVDQGNNRKKVLAYGHRLLCDSVEGELRHRWGSSKLYRLFSRDYQTFLRRPDVVMEQVATHAPGYEVAVVQSDLSNFYDRVRPALLHQQVRPFAGTEDVRFMELFQKLFAWRWKDETFARDYSRRNGIEGFESIALPQGLVASGFFANVAIHGVDLAIREYLDRPIDAQERFVLKDACYYVDDLRLVFLTKHGATEMEIELAVVRWLQSLLDQHAPGLKIETSKKKAIVAGRQNRFLVQQSRTASRIQRNVSGVFDMSHGSELIGAIEGFFYTQKRYPSQATTSAHGDAGMLTGISDMRDDTAVRFAAGRYRRTFRSLRPLLQSEELTPDPLAGKETTLQSPDASVSQLILSKQQLDQRGQLFSATLIEEWVGNPANVRLLRIALDISPDVRFLGRILELLQPGWRDSDSHSANREVRLYCLAEIFRAGASETGMVPDQECLPAELDVRAYHKRLVEEATDVLLGTIASPAAKRRLPWYLVQQAFFYLAARNQIPKQIILTVPRKQTELALHLRFARFLNGQMPASLQEQAIYFTLAYTSFGQKEILHNIAFAQASPEFLRKVCEISPETAIALWREMKEHASSEQRRMARSLGLEPASQHVKSQSLADHVVREYNPFWQEDNLLRLALGLLEQLPAGWPEALSPWQVHCEVTNPDGSIFGRLKDGPIVLGGMSRASHLFSVPSWCESLEEKHRFQLGALLRFALCGWASAYRCSSTQRGLFSEMYHPSVSCWERQRSAAFVERAAFGPPWIPISSWVEEFLFDLVCRPGSGMSSPVHGLQDWAELLKKRIDQLALSQGPATHLSFLEQTAPWPEKPPNEWRRPLRVGIVQSILPTMEDYGRHADDLELLTDSSFRGSQRRHLASIMEALQQMIRLRETHLSQDKSGGRVIDLLIFPELAIHPLDIDTFILPFVRTYKCIALFGQVYHPATVSPGSPLINTCLWMIPQWNAQTGFQVKRVEQGKANLTRPELESRKRRASFRPAQWILEYQWSSRPQHRPLRLSASVCYDATDLALASDLKSRSDVYIVCSLNRDVGTFERMAEGLHYHMYQGVIVVNNGEFGGSSFYMPYRDLHHRQVFYLHGQPQASIAFAEIDPDRLIRRPAASMADPVEDWKAPPANLARLK